MVTEKERNLHDPKLAIEQLAVEELVSAKGEPRPYPQKYWSEANGFDTKPPRGLAKYVRQETWRVR